MKTRLTLLLIAAGAAAAPAARAANMVVRNPTGDMRIKISIPLADDVNQSTLLTSGRIEIAPGEGMPLAGGSRHFVLTAATLRFADFTVDRAIFSAKHFRQVAVQLRQAVAFTAAPSSPGVYPFSIPREQVTLYGTTVMNGDIQAGTDHPSEPVTGQINLTNGTFRVRVVVPKHATADWCSWPVDCDIDGTLTVRLVGILGPDTDGDGIRDSKDNCPLIPNPRQNAIASPAIVAPPDIRVVSCQHRVFGRPEVADLCLGGVVTVFENAPREWPVGQTVVSWTAQDRLGRTTSARQLVTVDDRTAPLFKSVPPDIAADTCGPLDVGLPVAVDDCGFGPPLVTSDKPRSFGPGTRVVTWTATDGSGNRATAAQTVMVTDVVPPEFTYVPPSVSLDDCALVDKIGRALAKDACGVTVTSDAPPKFPPGETTVVTWTARDGAGNVATAHQKVECTGKGGGK
jgi:hypothetical protein